MTKIGIFGGSFNPVHNGHVNMAVQAAKELKLNKLLIVPTAVSPHKQSAKISFEDRAEMCRLAFEGCPIAEISDVERHLSGKSYTINTIRALQELNPNAQLFLIIGGDMLFSFEDWYRYESILKEAKVVAVARHDDEYINLLEYANELGRVKTLNIPVVDVSSTEIRKKLAAGEDISELVPEKVNEYIKEKSLYLTEA